MKNGTVVSVLKSASANEEIVLAKIYDLVAP